MNCGPATVLLLHQGSKTAILLYLVLRAHGLRIPLLCMIAIGMILAVRYLMIWMAAAA